MSRSVNSATILGNLTRDPEMRYTPGGSAVTNFAVATNRVWTNSEGERQEDVEFHEVVAWSKLAEICNQYLRKGSKVYIRGRLQTRRWEDKDGSPRQRTEIVARDMVMLDSRGGGQADSRDSSGSGNPGGQKKQNPQSQNSGSASGSNENKEWSGNENVDPKDMPF